MKAVVRATAGVAMIMALVTFIPAASSQQRPDRSPPSGSPSQGHEQHGTPKGWKFTWPKGDSAKGRAVFVKLECYSCHEVRGEKFPAPTDSAKLGPELAFMGPLHEVDYFAEAVINPSAVIEKGKDYQAVDGSSKMPSFNDSLTVQELIDLVAFLRALRPTSGGAGGHTGH
jgi:mono/diheme cytochrome c family protein